MIERTFNTALIREILSDSVLNERVTFGHGPDIFDPENQLNLYYLLALNEAGQELGFLLYHVINNPICYQGHANYLPKFWSEGLEKYSKESMYWLFENTDAEKIVTFCPTTYPQTRQHALKVGMIEEGYLTHSSLFEGEICDNHIMGMTKTQLINGG